MEVEETYTPRPRSWWGDIGTIVLAVAAAVLLVPLFVISMLGTPLIIFLALVIGVPLAAFFAIIYRIRHKHDLLTGPYTEKFIAAERVTTPLLTEAPVAHAAGETLLMTETR